VGECDGVLVWPYVLVRLTEPRSPNCHAHATLTGYDLLRMFHPPLIGAHGQHSRSGSLEGGRRGSMELSRKHSTDSPSPLSRLRRRTGTATSLLKEKKEKKEKEKKEKKEKEKEREREKKENEKEKEKEKKGQKE
jgi:hypothetical protein